MPAEKQSHVISTQVGRHRDAEALCQIMLSGKLLSYYPVPDNARVKAPLSQPPNLASRRRNSSVQMVQRGKARKAHWRF